MSTLLVRPLYTDQALSQDFAYKLNVRAVVGAFIPYIYMHNAPAGTFFLEVSTPDGVIFSQSFTCADIKTSLDTINDYAHVFFPVVPLGGCQIEKTDFTVTLYAVGYTYTAASFIGWIQQHEDLNNVLEYTPLNDAENPLALRLKVLKEGILCRR